MTELSDSFDTPLSAEYSEDLTEKERSIIATIDEQVQNYLDQPLGQEAAVDMRILEMLLSTLGQTQPEITEELRFEVSILFSICG